MLFNLDIHQSAPGYPAICSLVRLQGLMVPRILHGEPSGKIGGSVRTSLDMLVAVILLLLLETSWADRWLLAFLT